MRTPPSWVRERNAETVAELTGGEAFAGSRAEIRQVLDADDRIPYPAGAGTGTTTTSGGTRPTRAACGGAPRWRSTAGRAGVGRRCSTSTRWPPTRARTGSGSGATVLRPGYGAAWSRCPAAAPTRRWCASSTWPPGRSSPTASRCPRRRAEVSWIDADQIYVGTDFGPGSLTASGYPRIVKAVAARHSAGRRPSTVYEGRPDDVAVVRLHDPTAGFERDFVCRGLDFYRTETLPA